MHAPRKVNDTHYLSNSNVLKNGQGRSASFSIVLISSLFWLEFVISGAALRSLPLEGHRLLCCHSQKVWKRSLQTFADIDRSTSERLITPGHTPKKRCLQLRCVATKTLPMLRQQHKRRIFVDSSTEERVNLFFFVLGKHANSEAAGRRGLIKVRLFSFRRFTELGGF